MCSKCNTVGHQARSCKAPDLQQRMVRDEREPENDHSQSDAPMATDGDRHADDGDDECDQLNKTNDREPDDSMSMMTTMPIAMLMITATTMTTMMPT